MANSSTWLVALLRGVNVGGAAKVPMAILRTVVAACGYDAVRTHLNSGNVIFRGDSDTQHASMAIRRAVHDATQVDTPVMVFTRDELAAILAANPFDEAARAHPSRLLVMCWDARCTDADRQRIADMPTTVEQVHVGAYAAYLSLPDGISASKPLEVLGRHLKDRVTSRNWSTMTTLLSMMQDAPRASA